MLRIKPRVPMKPRIVDMVPFWPTTLAAGSLDERFLDQTPFDALGLVRLAGPAATAASG